MSRISKALSCICILISLSSCHGGQRQLGPAALKEWVEDGKNGLQKEVRSGDWVYKIQYKPHDYIIDMETRGAPGPQQYETRRKELEGSVSFNIEFRNEKERMEPLRIGLQDLSSYDQRLSYYLNEAQKDMVLYYGKTMLYPSGYVFEPNYNLLPVQRMVVSFTLPAGKKLPDQDMQFAFMDKIFNNGIIKAFFSNREIAKAPILDLTK